MNINLDVKVGQWRHFTKKELFRHEQDFRDF